MASPSLVLTSAFTLYLPCRDCQHWLLLSCAGGAYRRNLLGQVDVLGELHLALLQRALQIRLLDCLASVGVLVDQGDQVVVADCEVHLGTLLDLLAEVALGSNAESLSPRAMR